MKGRQEYRDLRSMKLQRLTWKISMMDSVYGCDKQFYTWTSEQKRSSRMFVALPRSEMIFAFLRGRMLFYVLMVSGSA